MPAPPAIPNQGLRLYEYEDDDGVVFWSFTRLPEQSFRRIKIVDKQGQHYRRHISDIQRFAADWARLQKNGG